MIFKSTDFSETGNRTTLSIKLVSNIYLNVFCVYDSPSLVTKFNKRTIRI